ncbi:DNA-processing protein DprA [Solwaraspora sp. WMMA2065]|uniref:DNA-processing protein DprA n=1 Tax=Solwaraspora sp. WMMA2065 TaxID=3015166 RepID=UPI00259B036F|nr:DNA-processing protein DprA [Solwaraspora sp. WMMA2065]WJK33059.1 DNA-processing protein DprA [Solwaraspora sp. WMMA2065]
MQTGPTSDTAADHTLDLLTLCAITDPELVRVDWQLIARTAQTPGDLAGWFEGEIREKSPKAERAATLIRKWSKDRAAQTAARDAARKQMAAAQAVGANVTTVLDTDYPANLRLVPDAPPFLFYRGHLESGDARSIAVVGTRQASEDGRRRAARMARGLCEDGIVVASGLALGIDTAAHTATVDLSMRTVAVIGNGIARPTYPKENAALAERIVEQGGAVVSQFWPTDPPDRWRFPARNVVMSGFTQGTIVVEASSTSGAKIQAQAAYKHGKLVFLLKSLAAAQKWARAMLDADSPAGDPTDLFTASTPSASSIRRVVEVGDISDVLGRIASAEAVQAAAEQRLRLAQSDLGAM